MKLAFFIQAVRTELQPVGRAAHAASTLEQLLLLTPPGVDLEDLALGWRTLSTPQMGDKESIAQRRLTCGELAAIAAQFTTEERGQLEQAILAWSSWLEALRKGEDPRQKAMALTFSRELIELQQKKDQLT